jgi:ABC-type phosphate transport system permease subunit
MTTFTQTVWSLCRVLIAGLVFGAGLPALFTLGIRLLAGTPRPDGTLDRPARVVRLAGGVCLITVAAVIVVAIAYIMKDFLADTFHIHLFGG